MPKLPPHTSLEVIRKLKLLGFSGPIPGSRHPLMVKGAVIIPVPKHTKTLGTGLLLAIIKQAGSSRDEWIRLG